MSSNTYDNNSLTLFTNHNASDISIYMDSYKQGGGGITNLKVGGKVQNNIFQSAKKKKFRTEIFIPFGKIPWIPTFPISILCLID